MTTATDVRIVQAGREHIPFVAWVVMAANRSHLPRGMWDLIIGDDEGEVLRHLEAMAGTPSTSATRKSEWCPQWGVGAGLKPAPAERLAVRVGLNAGEPIEEDGDLFGAL